MTIEDAAEVVDQTAAIAPQIRRFLRARIVNNSLQPGDKLSEAEIAKAYDVSRQPVREAFIKLADEGLILTRPQRSTLVRAIDYPTVLQIRFVREAVEADIVRMLAADPDPAVIRELRHQLARQSEVGDDNRTEFFRLDELFHRTIAEAAGKDLAFQFIEALNGQMDRVRVLSFGLFPLDNLIQQHTQIVDKIEAGDASGASQAMRVHLNEMIRTLPKIAQKHPKLFERAEGPTFNNPPS